MSPTYYPELNAMLLSLILHTFQMGNLCHAMSPALSHMPPYLAEQAEWSYQRYLSSPQPDF
jgi:hypothetical protein